MVDFTLQPFAEMIDLSWRCNLVWIDHHKTAIEESHRCKFKCKGWRAIGCGACWLTWEHLQPELDMIDMRPPLAVTLLADYDVWNHTDDRTLPFQYGLRLEADTRPDNQELWKRLFEDEALDAPWIFDGRIVLQYIEQDNKKYWQACGFETVLDGLKCVAINRMLTNSQMFDSVWDPREYHAMLTFGWRKGKWNVSLYSDRMDVDVGAIAKARGGGGHKGAAGFQCAVLPFTLKG